MKAMLLVILAVVLSVFLAWLAIRVTRKSAAARGSGRPAMTTIVMSTGAWAFLTYVSMSFALSTTNPVQTAIIVDDMETRSPFGAIARHDPVERARLRDAVSRGLDKAGGQDVESVVTATVSAELKPYMNRRLRQAPDHIYATLAPIVADAMRAAQIAGPCVLPGDSRAELLLRHADGQRMTEWADQLISTPAIVAQPPRISPEEETARRRVLGDAVVAKGVDRQSVLDAGRVDVRGKGRCGAAAAMLVEAMGQSDPGRSARDLRILLKAFVLPG